MNFKEFSFAGDVRVCIYNVGNENLDFHRHAHVSDITYCAAGRLLLELPESGQSCLFYPGQIVQVPAGTIHRVSHCSEDCNHSRYILIQLGRFNIHFERDTHMMTGCSPVDLGEVRSPFYLGDHLERLRQIGAAISSDRPGNVSDSEYADLQAALHRTCEDGIAGEPDTCPTFPQQLQTLNRH